MNELLTESNIVFEHPPDITAAQQCSQCGGWIIGGVSYFSDGKWYCPKCMFDGSGKFVDRWIVWRCECDIGDQNNARKERAKCQRSLA